jgi:hypothetical protein
MHYANYHGSARNVGRELAPENETVA